MACQFYHLKQFSPHEALGLHCTSAAMVFYCLISVEMTLNSSLVSMLNLQFARGSDALHLKWRSSFNCFNCKDLNVFETLKCDAVISFKSDPVRTCEHIASC